MLFQSIVMTLENRCRKLKEPPLLFSSNFIMRRKPIGEGQLPKLHPKEKSLIACVGQGLLYQNIHWAFDAIWPKLHKNRDKMEFGLYSSKFDKLLNKCTLELDLGSIHLYKTQASTMPSKVQISRFESKCKKLSFNCSIYVAHELCCCICREPVLWCLICRLTLEKTIELFHSHDSW